jgi:RNA polymerase sigma-70 factor (ECF subfamily)
MSEPAASTTVRAAASMSSSSGEDLECAFNEERTRLVSSLYLMLGNYEDALDAAQEAFLKCWRARDRLNGVGSIRSWIYRVAFNAAKDLQRNAWHRRAKPLSSATALGGDTSPSPIEALQDKETRERLRKAIMGLRPEEKAVYLLRENGELTYEEIAEIRHSPVGTVKTQMRAALQKLRQLLEEKV